MRKHLLIIAMTLFAFSRFCSADLYHGITTTGFVEKDLLREINGNSICIWLNWKEIEPSLEPKYVVNDILWDENILQEYIATRDWSKMDQKIRQCAGLNIFAILGAGWVGNLPKWNGKIISPDTIGIPYYLGHIFLYTQATAIRYRDVVECFIIEDELNEAPLTAAFGGRTPSPLDREVYWSDFSFLTDLMATLSKAVKLGAPGVPIMINLHTDFHPNFHSTKAVVAITGDKNWMEAAVLWSSYMDILGLDGFPNFYTADPVYGADIGERVAIARDLLPDKPIIVLSTGYPISRYDVNGDPIDWTEQKQADFVYDAYTSAMDSGAAGFFYFAPQSRGSLPPEGGYTEEDLEVLDKVGVAFRKGDVWGLFDIIAKYGIPYFRGRFADVMRTCGDFGLMRPDGTRRSGFDTLLACYSEMGQECFTMELTQGWNLISIPLKTPRVNISSVLSSVTGLYDSIWGYSTEAGWCAHIPGVAEGLKSLIPGEGYWADMRQEAELTIYGGLCDYIETPLAKGWNAVGYPSLVSKDISSCVRSIQDCVEILWGYDFNGWRAYIPRFHEGLDTMNPGMGYLINVTRDCLWEFAND